MRADTRYGYAHRVLREKWRLRVNRGGVACADPWCGRPIEPGDPWDLGHDPMDRTRWIGPMHARCNRSTALERRLAGVGKRGFRWGNPAW
jgi:hypothetical protein